ncbi:MAG TPA: hypothetical protein VGE00_06155 [Gammaproteobacteria bacterium]
MRRLLHFRGTVRNSRTVRNQASIKTANCISAENRQRQQAKLDTGAQKNAAGF